MLPVVTAPLPKVQIMRPGHGRHVRRMNGTSRWLRKHDRWLGIRIILRSIAAQLCRQIHGEASTGHQPSRSAIKSLGRLRNTRGRLCSRMWYNNEEIGWPSGGHCESRVRLEAKVQHFATKLAAGVRHIRESVHFFEAKLANTHIGR